MFHLTQNASFQRRSFQPTSWRSTDETKPNATKANNAETKQQKTHIRSKAKYKENSKQSILRTVICEHVIVHNCRTQHSTEQF